MNTSVSCYTILVVGDKRVGKTSLLYALSEAFPSLSDPHLRGMMEMLVDGIMCRFVLWECASDEPLPSNAKTTDGAFIVVDETNHETHCSVPMWREKILNACRNKKHYPIIVCGNKSDKLAHSHIPLVSNMLVFGQCEALLPYWKISAQTGFGCKETLNCMARTLRYQDGLNKSPTIISKPPEFTKYTFTLNPLETLINGLHLPPKKNEYPKTNELLSLIRAIVDVNKCIADAKAKRKELGRRLTECMDLTDSSTTLMDEQLLYLYANGKPPSQ
jgi:GTPase SAR1 family protein